MKIRSDRLILVATAIRNSPRYLNDGVSPGYQFAYPGETLLAVRKLDADLGRMYGNLKDLFSYSPGLARSHQSEINAALRAVRDLRTEIMPALLALRYAIIKPRDKADLLLAAIGGRRRYKGRGES